LRGVVLGWILEGGRAEVRQFQPAPRKLQKMSSTQSRRSMNGVRGKGCHANWPWRSRGPAELLTRSSFMFWFCLSRSLTLPFPFALIFSFDGFVVDPNTPSILSILIKSVCASLHTMIAPTHITLHALINPIPKAGATVLALVYMALYTANPVIHTNARYRHFLSHGRV
jgi:hypothetical protein